MSRKTCIRQKGRHAPKGFTLLELVVSAGIMAVLTVLLVPSLGRVRQQAAAVKCLNNLRQIGKAVQMYAMDNDQLLPFCNWDGGSVVAAFTNIRKGWLYEPPLTPGPGLPLEPQKVMSGALWPYLNDLNDYKCPLHDERPLRPATNTLTSYLMSGATYSPGGIPLGNGRYEKILYRVGQYKPDDIIMWEAEEHASGAAWNDGATYPGETYIYPNSHPYALGLAVHHGNKASVLRVDGVAEFIEHEEFYRLANDYKRNRLWCAPSTPNGHY